jgi:hypothetical protein
VKSLAELRLVLNLPYIVKTVVNSVQEGPMSLVFATILGFMFSPQPNALCAEVLHQLRTEHHMEVTSAQTVDDTLVYLLVDESHKKTAQIGCRLLPQP